VSGGTIRFRGGADLLTVEIGPASNPGAVTGDDSATLRTLLQVEANLLAGPFGEIELGISP
jgi:hypothetical protein